VNDGAVRATGGAAVVVGSCAWAQSLADGLAGRGWIVERLAAGTTAESSMEAVWAAQDRIGRPRLVVHVPSRPVVTGALVDLGPGDWDEACEAPLRAALFTAIAARRVLGDRAGGRLVFLLPLAELAGRAGDVAFGAALEGIRGMAKSAARRWGRAGITVNCVAFRAGDDAPCPAGSPPWGVTSTSESMSAAWSSS